MYQLVPYFRQLSFLPLVLSFYYSSAQVEQLNGPYDVHYINEFLIGNDNRVFVSTTGGLYQSDDFGAEWQKVDAYFNNVYFEPVLAKDSTGILYLADRYTVYFSDDNGVSWNMLTALPDMYDEGDIRSLYVKSDTLFIGTTIGLRYSVNKNWETIEFSGLKGIDIGGIRNSESALLVASKNQFFISTDEGKNWTNRTPPNENLEITDLEVINNEIYVTTTFDGVLFTDDAGLNWQEMNVGIHVKDNLLDIFRTENTLYLLSGQNLYTSGADIAGWKLSGNIPKNGPHTAIVAKENQILVGGWFGLFKSTDAGQNWSDAMSGITDADIRMMEMSEDSTIFAMSSSTGIYRKKKGEETFSKFNSREGLLLDKNLIYSFGGVVQANDIYTGELVKSFKYEPELTAVGTMVKAGGEYFISTLFNGIWKYTDQEEWERFNEGLPTQKIGGISLFGSTLYAATEKGIFISDLSEANWKKMDVAGDPADARHLLVEGEIIVASLGMNTYVSRDLGKSWTVLKMLENKWVYDIASQNDEIFIATIDMVFVSKDRGLNWRILCKFERNPSIESLLPVGNHLYVGTTENGTFKVNTNIFEPKIALALEEGSIIDNRISFSDAANSDIDSILLTIYNRGNDTLILGDPPVIIEGENASSFSFAGLPAHEEIAPYGSVSFLLKFRPTAVGEHEAKVKIVSNDAQNPILSLGVYGKTDILSSAHEKKPGFPIVIAPNPVQGNVRLSGPEWLKNSVVILRDATGKHLKTQNIRHGLGGYELDASGLTSGMYILTIMNKGKIWHGKFLKE